MARYQVILSYDGTDYFGFQRQNDQPSVQSAVERSLKQIGWAGTTILSAGRTDTGVHASGQVIAFDLNWQHTTEDLLHALNAALPADIAARQVAQAADDFHPRFDAASREYEYRILIDPARDPLHERFCWRVDFPLDVEILHRASAAFLGRHDFRAYGNPPRTQGSTVRDVLRSQWLMQDGVYLFAIKANAFLYHMVRRIVFLQIAAASGKVDVIRFEQTLVNGFDDHPGIAPARGLILKEVTYPADGSLRSRTEVAERNEMDE